MNKVGIGDLKHAKPAKTGASTAQTKLSQTPREAKTPDNKKAEGQLSVDIVQSEDKMIIICPIAGVEKSEIKVAIQDDVLTIRGERKPIRNIDHNQSLVRELFWGTFSRSIVLPDHIDRGGIEAKTHEHMLVITIPKTEDFKTRIIHINETE
ncbi:Hsp20/alpha crystallin family protein [Candidatus Peregrinibacteria bacterium]|jgi:HSP20 family protein|nr:Hsp20/alpha crystallin family protein [Candidatus Peregrinibacteria bacterium]MBT4632028.1 Hsp20/alpha crystallin family protein [Candidatus Peregrinibacteria bacterium]MBT5516332.1 Hsp20/alpha crystallin family protein [Candidatus Peregrinibacteria bacterium]MBT5824408.1 Hsp20/alpha crystallin family protein [Candidatus Peregrinibacteria bacterium]